MDAPQAPATALPPPGHVKVSVITPEGPAYEGLAESVVLPAHDGEVAFFPGHAPFVGAVGIGELRIRVRGEEVRRWYLEGGVAQVLDGVVTVLAERIVPSESVDAGKAQADLSAALAALPTTDEDFQERDRALESARARLRVSHTAPGSS